MNESSLTHIPAPYALVLDSRRKPMITVAGLELEIDSNTFQNGKARLKCVANIFSLYQREVELVFDEERPRPRPSSVLGTRDAASGTQIVVAYVIWGVYYVHSKKAKLPGNAHDKNKEH